jgi:hypothetical protein
MDGGEQPIRDGDWPAFRWAHGKPSGAVEGRVELVATTPQWGTPDVLVKRLVRDGNGGRSFRTTSPKPITRRRI